LTRSSARFAARIEIWHDRSRSSDPIYPRDTKMLDRRYVILVSVNRSPNRMHTLICWRDSIRRHTQTVTPRRYSELSNRPSDLGEISRRIVRQIKRVRAGRAVSEQKETRFAYRATLSQRRQRLMIAQYRGLLLFLQFNRRDTASSKARILPPLPRAWWRGCASATN